MIRDAFRTLQALIRAEYIAGRAQRLDRNCRDIHDHEPTRRRLGHPSRDVEIHAVRPTDGQWEVGVSRNPNDLEWHTCEGMEWVLDGDARRLGIVRCCS